MNVTTRDRGTPHRCAGDRGGALVEATMITPIFVLLVMAIVEYGLLFKDYLNTSAAVADGAKYGAVQGPTPTTDGQSGDMSIIKTVRANLGSMPNARIERIVVFRAGPAAAGAPLAQVPAACRTATASIPGCNVYLVPDAFVAVEAGRNEYFTCAPGGTVACGWDPAQRANGPRVADIEYLGVYIKISRPRVTNLFPLDETLEIAAVNRLEPGVLT